MAPLIGPWTPANDPIDDPGPEGPGVPGEEQDGEEEEGQ